MKAFILAIACITASAQSLDEMGKPLPWRRLAARYVETESTWTGREQADVDQLIDLTKSYFVAFGAKGYPASALKEQTKFRLLGAKLGGMSSGQGKEQAAKLVWETNTGIWRHVVLDGTAMDGEDLNLLARKLDAGEANNWGIVKLTFRLALTRWQTEDKTLEMGPNRFARD